MQIVVDKRDGTSSGSSIKTVKERGENVPSAAVELTAPQQ